MTQVSEVEKLKQEIDELEEDLESLQDDLKSANNKLRNKDAEIESLEKNNRKLKRELDEEQNKVHDLNSELYSLHESIKESSHELELKNSSLNLVQELISAKEIDRGDVKQLEANIAEMKSFVLGQMLDCLKSLKERELYCIERDFEGFKQKWEQRFYEWASITRKSWINGKTTVAFIGEFSAGKTSIVNRILSQDDKRVPQLPVSTNKTTAIPTYIAGGPIESYQFVTPDEKLKVITKETFTQKVSKEVLDKIDGISSLIQYFVMTYKNPHLDGLSILDTPGFNSDDKNDAKRTMEVINECDALFWVFDVNSGTINRTSIQVIKKYLHKPLYVVINKVDTKPASEIQRVENLIKDSMEEEGICVTRYIRFSSKEKLDSIMNPVKEVTHSSGNDNYLSDVEFTLDLMLEGLNLMTNKTRKKLDEAKRCGGQINDKFKSHIETLRLMCGRARDVPHHEYHFFGSDNYEMTETEYGRLCCLLNIIEEEAEGLENFLEAKTDSAKDMQQAWFKFSEIRAAWATVDEMKDRFKILKQNFK